MDNDRLPSATVFSLAWRISAYSGLIALAVTPYLQTLQYGFILFDDPAYVIDNPRVTGGLSWKNIWWAFTGFHAGNWHPLTWLSLMLDSQIYGMNPRGFHLTNVILHALNVSLLFSLLMRLFRQWQVPVMVAALFAVHPMHVESIAWITERKDVLGMLFWLLTIQAYLRYTACRSTLRYLAVLSLFSIGLMVKQMLVTLPLILLLLDYWPLHRMVAIGVTRAVVLEKTPLLLVSAIASGITIHAARLDGAMNSLGDTSLLERLGNSAVAYTAYLGKFAWPTDLAMHYPHPALFGETWPLLTIVLSTLLIIIISSGCFLTRHRAPYLTFGWLWFLITLVPVIGLLQVGEQFMADRYTYFSYTGLYIALTWFCMDAWHASGVRPLIAGVAATLVVSVLLLVSYRQASYWRDNETLFQHALAVDGRNPVIHNLLGVAMQQAGNINSAMAHYRSAVAFDPARNSARINLANALLKLGDRENAIYHYRIALQHSPGNFGIRNRLGALLTLSGDCTAAGKEYAQVLKARSTDVDALNGLAWVLATCPNDAARNGERAVKTALHACELTQFNNPTVLDTLAAAYAETGDYPAAIGMQRKIVRLLEGRGDEQSADIARRRLAVYERSQPYRDD